jgi:hypothetical protein
VAVTASTAGYGIDVTSDSRTVRLAGVEVEALGGALSYGIRVSLSSVEARSVGIVATGDTGIGVFASGSAGDPSVIRIDNSTIRSSDATLSGSSGFTTFVGSTKLDGGAVVAGSGTIVCAGVWNESYTFSSSTCP